MSLEATRQDNNTDTNVNESNGAPSHPEEIENREIEAADEISMSKMSL